MHTCGSKGCCCGEATSAACRAPTLCHTNTLIPDAEPALQCRVPSPLLRDWLRRIVNLLPDADANLLVATVTSDLPRSPPELLALKVGG